MTTTVTSQIPDDLAELLGHVAELEERSKSYYIKKGLEQVLRQRLEDLEDYATAIEAYDEHIAEGGETVPLSDAFREE